VRSQCVGGRCTAVGWKPVDADFALLDRALGGLLNVGPDLSDIAVLGGSTDGDGLNQELVAAASVRRRVVLHGLKKYLDLDMLARLNATGVWADAVLLGRSRLDLESDWILIAVGESQDLTDFVGERALEGKLGGSEVDAHGVVLFSCGGFRVMRRIRGW